jgi:hypothetical protein
MDIIAFYLPQFHQIPENDEWWGEGFTEWVNVKKAESLYEGHEQPVVPLNNNYYDLSDIDVMKWQINLASTYGISGFCFYHYWFNGKLLLEKPVERYLHEKSLSFPYCLCWANEHWTKGWVSKYDEVLIEQSYGSEKEWKEHFDYLLPFISDERYIKINGEPLLIIYRPELIECLNDMLDYWQKLAKQNGIKRICFAYQHIGFDLLNNSDTSRFTFNIEYQPMYALHSEVGPIYKLLRGISKKAKNYLPWFKNNYYDSFFKEVRTRDYSELWRHILNMKPLDEKRVPGAFVRWDNTPRKGRNGLVTTGVSPDLFKNYMKEQIKRTKDVYKKNMIFLFAWNEWAEGGYLEPDEKNGYRYLQALKEALTECDEFPR